ncbi:MAG TPA: PEGA domain-containing protein [Kofleriaceae bacterium]|nr:PEGA domain-containing protein [Kofleriaceae bacterium]
MAWRVTSLVLAALAVTAHAQPAPEPSGGERQVDSVIDPAEVLNKKIAVWRFDALGIDPEIVQRLETLFRMELDRLDKQPLPSRTTVEKAVTPAEQNCTGEEKCLAAIGKRLGVDLVVTGTVGSLGDNYVLNIKVVDVATGKSQKMQSDPLRGSPDDLIEGVRVAAYKLLAPDQLHGAVQIQSDIVGAQVALDGKDIGKTPLPNQGVIGKLALGKHHLRVESKGYDVFDQDLEVHFQKVSPVLVKLLPSTEVIGTGKTVTVVRNPIYTRPWFIVAVGVGAIALGGIIGYESTKTTCNTFKNGMLVPGC